MLNWIVRRITVLICMCRVFVLHRCPVCRKW